MVKQDSELYRAHPDWILHTEEPPYLAWPPAICARLRARKSSSDYIHDSIYKVAAPSKITTIKWDMNRGITEVRQSRWEPEHQGEIFHPLHILGVYSLCA